MAKRLGMIPSSSGYQRVEACVDPRPSSLSIDPVLHLAERLRAVTAVVAPTPSSRLEIAITV